MLTEIQNRPQFRTDERVMKPGHMTHMVSPDTPSLPLYEVTERICFNITGETCQVMRFRADRSSELTVIKEFRADHTRFRADSCCVVQMQETQAEQMYFLVPILTISLRLDSISRAGQWLA